MSNEELTREEITRLNSPEEMEKARKMVYDIYERLQERADQARLEGLENALLFFENDDAEGVNPKGDTGTLEHGEPREMLKDGTLERNIKKGVDYNDAVQQLLAKYGDQWSDVKHGNKLRIGRHNDVSWNVERNEVLNKAVISYSLGGEWAEDCYPESVPSWLLLHIARKLKGHITQDVGAQALIKGFEQSEKAKEAARMREEMLSTFKLNMRRTARAFGDDFDE